MESRLKVGGLCASELGDTYVILKVYAYKPVSVQLIATRHQRYLKIGTIVTQEDNGWVLYPMGCQITDLEKVIYGVCLEAT